MKAQNDDLFLMRRRFDLRKLPVNTRRKLNVRKTLIWLGHLQFNIVLNKSALFCISPLMMGLLFI